MKICFLLLLVLNPLGALAQGVVYVPSSSIPGTYLNQYGVMIEAAEITEYNIDINGDGIVDYTLNVNHTLAGSDQFSIAPMGRNGVLAYVDQYGGANAVNLGAGEVIGSQSGGSLSPIWANSGNSYPAVLNYVVATGVIGDPAVFGTFVNTTGFVGLQFWANNQAYYGFLQMDTRFSLYGGLYQGYGWNTTPGDSITTTYFRDLIQVPEPSTLALLALFGVAAGLLRRKHSLK